MNRVILIGNGFDLAHGLKTSYADFINWYWAKWGYRLLHGIGKTEKDRLCSFVLNDSIDIGKWSYVWQGFYYKRDNPFDLWDEHQVVGLAKQNHDLCTFSITSPFFKERFVKQYKMFVKMSTSLLIQRRWPLIKGRSWLGGSSCSC